MNTEINKVINNNFCIGCGVCTTTSHISKMDLDDTGKYIPILDKTSYTSSEKICPFSDKAPNENEIANKLFSENNESYDDRIGFYNSVIVGHAIEGNYRKLGSSGGLTNWVLSELLDKNLVDGIIGVGPARTDSKLLYEYKIAHTPDEVSQFSKSKYYPITLDKVLRDIKKTNKRYAVVGVPCFIKSIRSLCLEDEDFNQRIAYAVSIVCGHLKTTGFAEHLGWQLGVPPSDLQKLDFRVKVKDEPANRYAVQAVGASSSKIKQVFDLNGTDWGLGYFKPKACDFCDDIGGETADVCLGDAWLPSSMVDSKGTNIAIVRNPVIWDLMKSAAKETRIFIQDSSPSEFHTSQAANYRHRHEGLSYRLKYFDENEEWRPKKRIEPVKHNFIEKRHKLFRQRSTLSSSSISNFIEAKQRGSLSNFHNSMRPSVIKYYYLSGTLTKFSVKSLFIFFRRHFKRGEIKTEFEN